MSETPDKVGARRVYLKDVRLSFPKLKNPTASVKGGEKKRRAVFLIDPTTDSGKKNIKNLKAAVAAVVAELWDGKMPVLKDDRKCVFKGEGPQGRNKETGEIYEGYDGMVCVKAATADMPTLLHRNKAVVEFEQIDQVFFGGCQVEGIVTLYGVKGQDKGGNGIFAGLNGVRFWKEDTAFGASRVTAEDFDDDEGDDFQEGTAEDNDLGF